MVVIKAVPRDEMMARQEKVARRLSSARAAVSKVPFNLGAVLDMGEVTFANFRGRAYGVPPLPWQEGQRLQAAYLELSQFKGVLTKTTAQKYYGAMAKLPSLMWRNCYPVARWRRVLKFLRVLPNPFLMFNEEELVEASLFFLARRMRSGVYTPTRQTLRLAQTP